MRVGDVVRHKAGSGYRMVIETIGGTGQAFCTWLNTDGEPRNDTFALLSLEPWDEGEEPTAPAKCMTVGELRKAMEGFRDDQLVMVDNDQVCVDAVSAEACSVPVDGDSENVDALLISINHEIGEPLD